jgi:hypothetical protein
MCRACSTHEGKRNAYRDLFGKPEEKIPLGRPRRRWEDNTKIGWDYMDWIHVAEDRNQRRALEKTEMNLWVLRTIENFVSS